MPRSVLILMLQIAWCGAAGPLQAQRGDVRYGFWASAGAAPGLATIECSRCAADPQVGIAGYLQVGGTPAEKISLGIEGGGWVVAGADTTRELVTVTAVVFFYPSAYEGLFVKVGGGAARYAEESPAQLLSSHGFVMQVAVGYELRLVRRVWAVPFANYLFAPSQAAKRNGLALASPLDLSMVQLGIGITWRKL